MGGTAIQVPSIHLLRITGPDVEVGTSSWFLEVEGSMLGAGGSLDLVAALLCIQLDGTVHEEQSGFLLCFRDVSGSTTISIASEMGAVSCPVAGIIAVEAEIAAVHPTVTVSTSCLGRLCSSTSATAVAIVAWLVLAAARTSQHPPSRRPAIAQRCTAASRRR